MTDRYLPIQYQVDRIPTMMCTFTAQLYVLCSHASPSPHLTQCWHAISEGWRQGRNITCESPERKMVRVDNYCLRCNQLVIRGMMPEDPCKEDKEVLERWAQKGGE